MRLVTLYQAETREAALRKPPLLEAIVSHRNSVLQPDVQIAAATQQALQMSVFSSGEGFAISDQDIADLRSIRDGVVAAWTDVIDKLVAVAEIRQHNLPRFDCINMLSLGGDCFSRTVLTRWGLKRTAKLGERSGPFDLAVTSPEAVDALLQNDFDGFMEPANLIFKRNIENCWNTRYHINFNHERGPEFAIDEFAKLRTIYEARVANFRQTIAESTPLFLMLYLPIFMPAGRSYVSLIKGILHRIQAQRTGPTTLLVVNSYAHEDSPGVEAFFEDDFEWCNIPLPHPEYCWHDASWFMSDLGIAYEREVIARVKMHLDRVGLLSAVNQSKVRGRSRERMKLRTLVEDGMVDK